MEGRQRNREAPPSEYQKLAHSARSAIHPAKPELLAAPPPVFWKAVAGSAETSAANHRSGGSCVGHLRSRGPKAPGLPTANTGQIPHASPLRKRPRRVMERANRVTQNKKRLPIPGSRLGVLRCALSRALPIVR